MLMEDAPRYEPGRRKRFFNSRVFLLWMTAAYAQALLTTVLAFVSFGNSGVSEGVALGDMWSTGTVVYLWVVLGANVTILAAGRLFPLTALFGALSVGAHPLALLLVERIGGRIGENHADGTFWIIYGGANAVFLASTLLFVALFLLVGAPPLRAAAALSSAPEAPGRRSARTTKVAPEESTETSQESSTRQRPRPKLVNALPSLSGSASPGIKRLSVSTGHAYSVEDSLSWRVNSDWAHSATRDLSEYDFEDPPETESREECAALLGRWRFCGCEDLPADSA